MMDFNDPHNCEVWFQTIAEMFDCVITAYDFENRIVEFNGADDNLKKLERYIADHTQ